MEEGLFSITVMLLCRECCRLILFIMQAQSKPDRNRLLYFLKQAGQQLRSASHKDRQHLKGMVKADKMINHSEDRNPHFPDATHLLRREVQKKRYDEKYRIIPEERSAGLKQGKEGERIGILITKSEIKKDAYLQSIDEELVSQRNKPYQIPITSNRLREKCDKNGISFIKFASPTPQPTEDSTSASTISHNFNTYFQFKQFMSKLSSGGKEKGKISMFRGLNSASKKCSIMPALKPTLYKPKTKNQSFNSNSKIDHNQEYLQTKRTKIRLEQSLMVESKKQELATHVVTKYRETKSKLSDEGNDDTIEQSSSKMSPTKKQHQTLSPKFSQTQRSKKKPISFSYNSHNQQGVYQQKMRTYRQFLFLVNLAHRVFDPLVILDATVIRLEKTPIVRPTYYVGSGNNAILVRSLMKRRIWWDEVSDYRNANFVWTQLKIPSIFERQRISEGGYYEETILQQPQGANNDEDGRQESLAVPPVRKYKRKIKSSMQQINMAKVLTTQKCNYSIYEAKKQPAEVPKGAMFKAPFAVSSQSKILCKDEAKYYARMIDRGSKGDIDCFESRLKHLPKDYLQLRNFQESLQVHNHLECNHSLGNKKALFYHMQLYYKLSRKSIVKAFPQTYHIRTGEADPQFNRFLAEYQQIAKNDKNSNNIWILKPGENSNRGSGITVIKQINELRKLLRNRQRHRNGQGRTFILQKYIERPLLYRGRKFDLRHYMIISALHGRLRAYWYGQGYVRTSSYPFSLQQTSDPMVHLTNDAIQKQGQDYGCHQQGNKVSYNQLQKYFSTELPQKHFDMGSIYSKMRELAKDAVCATYVSLDPKGRLHNFEIFGLDFMIDEDLEVMLIEVNTNPCLELSSGLLSRVIPFMLEQTFRISLDPLFPPQVHYTNNTKHLAPDCSLEKLQLELLFDSTRDGRTIAELYNRHSDEYTQMMGLLQGSEKQLDEVFQSEGAEIEIQGLIG